ncbi:MAG: hypothetical protein LC122_01545 [Chitinophagales bacterium]|nr:hypothetical protein [Chitinophagales bacterium]
MKIISTILIVIIIFSFLTGCEKNKESGNDENTDMQKSSEISESDVAGFYTGRGLYNASDATIELYYGGSFEMEDPYLPEGGSAFGKWMLRGNSIDFYMNGQKTFSAEISAGKKIRTINNADDGTDDFIVRGIIIKGQLWKKAR